MMQRWPQIDVMKTITVKVNNQTLELKYDRREPTIQTEEILDFLIDHDIDLFNSKSIKLVKNGKAEVLTDKGVSNDDTLEFQLEKTEQPQGKFGPNWSLDTTIGLIAYKLNPNLILTYNVAGFTVQREYKANLQTVGIKQDFAFRAQFIWINNAPMKAIHKREQIEIEKGIDVIWGFHVTYATFKNQPNGAMLLVGIPIGFSAGIGKIAQGHLHPYPARLRA